MNFKTLMIPHHNTTLTKPDLIWRDLQSPALSYSETTVVMGGGGGDPSSGSNSAAAVAVLSADDASSVGGSKDDEDDDEDDGDDKVEDGGDPERLKAFNVSLFGSQRPLLKV